MFGPEIDQRMRRRVKLLWRLTLCFAPHPRREQGACRRRVKKADEYSRPVRLQRGFDSGFDRAAHMPLLRDRVDDTERFRSAGTDRQSTRLNSSHANITYADLCLKKKKVAHDVGADGRVVGDVEHPGVALQHVTGAVGDGGFLVTAPATTEIYTLSLHDALPI